MGTSLVPQDDVNALITDLKADLTGLGRPDHRAKQCTAMSQLHDRLNSGRYEPITGPVKVNYLAAKRVNVKTTSRAGEGKYAHEWVTLWHGYSQKTQQYMLEEHRYPARLKTRRERNTAWKTDVQGINSWITATRKVWARSSEKEKQIMIDTIVEFQNA